MSKRMKTYGLAVLIAVLATIIIFSIFISRMYKNSEDTYHSITERVCGKLINSTYKNYVLQDVEERNQLLEQTYVLNDKKSILYVSHDEEDGMWQFLCGQRHETEDARLVSLKSIFDMDNTVGKLFDMSCGCHAERASIKDDWVIN